MTARIARWRVPLGFVAAVIAFWVAQPSTTSVIAGLAVALAGEAIRLWASGHLDKGREITTSGPYRIVRHPLYLGSAIMALGFVIATRSWIAAAVASVYFGLTYLATIQAEETTLDERFGGAYSAYREGRAAAVDRSFSFTRVAANREYRAIVGLVIAFGLLTLKR